MGVGLVAAIMDLLHPHTFSTILEVDFGTPYDRHMLIVESDESRKRPTLKIPKLEEPITAGLEATSKLIRSVESREAPMRMRNGCEVLTIGRTTRFAILDHDAHVCIV